ncbi:hypothetical protein [Natrinema gelatinilyticum]|uniref:hypothetical protein n=1 Tax=Natrinema gelatinilyticum TaxID=2961571 RepID=UPI0020C27546|nr:hypothetical protein [Natrinema gelatinilyticum]
MPRAYCGECDWQHRVDEDDPVELSRAMIDHFVETGHSPVERCDSNDRLPDADGAETTDATTGTARKKSSRW